MRVKVDKRKWEVRSVQLTVAEGDEAWDVFPDVPAKIYRDDGRPKVIACGTSFKLFDAEFTPWEGWGGGDTREEAVRAVRASFRKDLASGLFVHNRDGVCDK